MAEKESTERRTYNLPTELVERLRLYQSEQNISNETEAVRRLLTFALQSNDSLESILSQIKERYREERDLRLLAKDILAGHMLVRSVSFKDGEVLFELTDDSRGRIDRKGTTYRPSSGYGDDWEPYPTSKLRGVSPQVAAAARSGSASSATTGSAKDAPSSGWEPSDSDLDDEIPF